LPGIDFHFIGLFRYKGRSFGNGLFAPGLVALPLRLTLRTVAERRVFEAQTAVFGAFSIAFIAQIASILWLARDKPNSVEEVARVFNIWIPVFSGLFGSAATFYFTQGGK
jgi:hypothetical protein